MDADDSLEEDGKVWISGNDEEHHPAADQNHQRRDHPLEVNAHFGLKQTNQDSISQTWENSLNPDHKHVISA